MPVVENVGTMDAKSEAHAAPDNGVRWQGPTKASQPSGPGWSTHDARDGADEVAWQRQVAAEIAAYRKEADVDRMKLGTWKVNVNLRAARGLKNRPIPFTISVDLCGKQASADNDVTTFFCQRVSKARAGAREMVRGPGEWVHDMRPDGCGGTIHPDHYISSARRMTCPHCGLRSFPSTLMHTLSYSAELPLAAVLIADHLQRLKLDASLVVGLWKSDRFTDRLLDPTQVQTHDATPDLMGRSRRVAIYQAASIIRDMHAGTVPLDTLVLRALQA